MLDHYNYYYPSLFYISSTGYMVNTQNTLDINIHSFTNTQLTLTARVLSNIYSYNRAQ